jgi:geranylgeranyl diphosphate synthase, type I
MTTGCLPLQQTQMLSALDAALRTQAARLQKEDSGLWQMVCYAMGWHAENLLAGGKRIRPLLVLLVAGSIDKNWRSALPAACAVELLHTFSLVHDDIQDNSDLRRGVPTLWRKYGIAHAINAGDALFTLAFAALTDAPAELTHRMLTILTATCARLTQGQYLDMNFEQIEQASLAQYQEMIDGKTAALIEGSSQLGAVAARAAPEREAAFAQFGRGVGLAFQAQDDFLGIWGHANQTGKSNASDLISRKKSLPILFGLQHSTVFRKLLAVDPVEPNLPLLIQELEACGAREFTLEQAQTWTDRAFSALQDAAPAGECGGMLTALAQSLLGRSS